MESLTVGDLIERLSQFDRDLPVAIYSGYGECGGFANEVCVEYPNSDPFSQRWCNGGLPADEIAGPTVTIGADVWDPRDSRKAPRPSPGEGRN